ncbi:MAG: hypothetical protein J6U90_03795 [Methanobrevibacter sp.]|nr:hypothetical protein [Methanobrevibacter sp.]
MRFNTLNLAEDYGLDIIEITEGLNGYPKNIYKGIIGFNNFMSAIEFADIINGEVVLLSRKDGHHFYINNGTTDKPIHYTKLIDDNAHIYFDIDDLKESMVEIMKDTCHTLEECSDFINRVNDFVEEFYDIQDNNSNATYIITYNTNKTRDNFDVIPEYVMKGSFDTTNYIIGVVENEDDTVF